MLSQGAISDCDAALLLEPHNASALSERGEAKRLLGDYPVCLRALPVFRCMRCTCADVICGRAPVE